MRESTQKSQDATVMGGGRRNAGEEQRRQGVLFRVHVALGLIYQGAYNPLVIL